MGCESRGFCSLLVVMIRPGLVSITFRELAPLALVHLAAEAQLEGIEWGGDVHVPHGEEATAREVARMTSDHGLEVAAYGSYYRAAASEAQGLSFGAVLSSAKALGAPVVRVWAGTKGSLEVSPGEREAVVADLRRITEIASREGVAIALEYHRNTLTDTPQSTRDLLEACACPGLETYWQPRVGVEPAETARDIGMLLPWLSHLHVYHWWPETQRLPLREGLQAWGLYLEEARCAAGERYAMLEFVRGSAPQQCLEDARALREWLASSGSDGSA